MNIVNGVLTDYTFTPDSLLPKHRNVLDESAKRLIEDVKDFCIYGLQVLDEETAKDYLSFLVDAVNKVKERYGDKAVEKVDSKINTFRFNTNLATRAASAHDYFEGKSLEDFERAFNKMFTQLRDAKDEKGKPVVNKDWVKWIQGTFNNYICRFEKRSSDIETDLGDQVDWIDKGKYQKGDHLPSSSKVD